MKLSKRLNVGTFLAGKLPGTLYLDAGGGFFLLVSIMVIVVLLDGEYILLFQQPEVFVWTCLVGPYATSTVFENSKKSDGRRGCLFVCLK